MALALVSSLKDKPTDPQTVAFGEVGLAGELRTVGRAQARVEEAARLGFARCILPAQSQKALTAKDYGIELIGVRGIREAVRAALE